MSRKATLVVMSAVALGLCLASSPVPAQVPPDSLAALTCQLTTNKWLSKVVREVGKCSQRCIGSGRRLGGPYWYYGCINDYYDSLNGEMKGCVGGTPTNPGILPKAAAAIAEACLEACPACYEATCLCYEATWPSSCPEGASLISEAAGWAHAGFGLLGSIYCKEGYGETPSSAEARCEDATAASTAKYVAAKQRCYGACVKAEFLGKIPPGNCLIQSPAGPGDLRTARCIARARRMVRERIERHCPRSAVPYCWSHDGTGFIDEADVFLDSGLTVWTTPFSSVYIPALIPAQFCGSPSGAFLGPVR